jgi:glycosyltransferase involved in cell wall biosynthesis
MANGFDSSTFRPADKREARRELGIPEEGRVLVTVGYLEPVKGHSYLIDAMAEVTEGVENVRLYILGDGLAPQEPRGPGQGARLSNVVNFVYEPMRSSGIARWMSAADLLASPAWERGTPR